MNYTLTAIAGYPTYMLATAASGGLFLSSNFGATWRQIQSVSNTGVWSSLALSYTGQYMVACGGANAPQPNQTGLAANTWTQGSLSWTALGSSNLNANFPNYGAFNGIYNTSGGSQTWASVANYSGTGAYNNTYSTVVQGGIGTVNGEWIQIQSQTPLTMYSYQLD